MCSEVRVEGLETLDYFDNLMHRERFTEQADAVTFDGEVMISTSPFLISKNLIWPVFTVCEKFYLGL